MMKSIIMGLLFFSSVNAFSRVSLPRAHASARALALPSVFMATDVLTRPPDVVLAPAKPAGDLQNAKGKKFKVLLFNDSVNKREFVARVLTGTIPEMTEATAYTVMQKAHMHGFAVCGVWIFELAEAYCDGLTSQGLTAAVTAESDE
jgi:ATP-dependent Clp protease adapter protein ClpS